MLLRLLKIPWLVFTRGEAYDVPLTRNPIAWIPFFLALPVLLAAWLLVSILGYVLLLPLSIVGGYFHHCSFQRKAGVFSDAGIHFPKAYGGLTIGWSEIREVVREREPKAIFYRIICGIAPEVAREYIMSTTPDDEAFERTLQERGIPFRIHDRFHRTETAG